MPADDLSTVRYEPEGPLREQAGAVRELLLAWFDENGRDFPWRRTRDPYAILISEIMLTRTRADQVEPVYEEFVSRFPDVETLGATGEAEIAEVLRPLGLAKRASQLIDLADVLRREYGGAVPVDRDELLSLPGVGDYVADAIRCFAHGRPTSIIDSNVVRVLGRIFGSEVDWRWATAEERRGFLVLAEGVRPPDESCRDHNWAVLDFGSVVCKPRSPKCTECPVGAAGSCSYALESKGESPERES